MDMKQPINVPKLRFPGFEGEWNNQEVNNITVWKSGGTPSKEVGHYWNGSIPWISASSMRGMVYSDSEWKLTDEGLRNGSKLAKRGELLILVRGSMLFNKIPVGIAGRDVAFNQDVKSISVRENVNGIFLLYWFYSQEPILLNLVTGTGIGAGKLELDDLKRMNIALPSLPEQTKIASFLSKVDEKITQLKKKKELLEQYKKGVMQKIFSQEVRFKEGSEPWTPILISEAIEKRASNVSANSLVGNTGKYKIYGATGLIGSINFYTEEECYISIVKDGAGVGRLQLCEANSSVLGTLDKLKNKPGFDLIFLYYRLSLIDFDRFVTGSTIPHIYFKDYSKEVIQVPSLGEQTKIANFLSAIDKKINHTQTQIEKAEQWKKGLLQQMFV